MVPMVQDGRKEGIAEEAETEKADAEQTVADPAA